METERLILRKAVFEDWRDLYENVWRHPETAKYMFWLPAQSEEEAQDRARRRVLFEARLPGNWVVVEKASGRVIGFCGVEEKEPGVYMDRGVALGPAFTGKGYGKEMVGALIAYVRGQGGRVFQYNCRVDNAASNALARSCGFRHVGQVDLYFEKEGRCCAENCYEMTFGE